MSGTSSHSGAGHEQDMGFGRVLWLVPVSMILLLAYVAICKFGATSSLKKEIARKQIQSTESVGGNGVTP